MFVDKNGVNMEKKLVKQQLLTGERALFASKDLRIEDSIFDDGESPLKESSNIELVNSSFKWKYPLWYCNNVNVKDCYFFEMGRAGVWYTNDINVEDTIIEAPKNFRRCNRLGLKFINCTIESLQGLCYIDNLVMKNCKLINTTLAFEYSTVDADITSRVDSVLNPTSGTITADSIDKLIIEKDKVDPSLTKIVCRN